MSLPASRRFYIRWSDAIQDDGKTATFEFDRMLEGFAKLEFIQLFIYTAAYLTNPPRMISIDIAQVGSTMAISGGVYVRPTFIVASDASGKLYQSAYAGQHMADVRGLKTKKECTCVP